MKKLLSIIFALCLFGLCVSPAMAFFQVADPQNSDGAPSEKVPVHNDAANAETLDAGSVVVWDIDASTGNNDLYVATTTTASTSLVAGVIWPNDIAAGNSGSMVVYGFAECDVSTTEGAAANSILCTGVTAGDGAGCTIASDEAHGYALTQEAASGGTSDAQVQCFVLQR